MFHKFKIMKFKIKLMKKFMICKIHFNLKVMATEIKIKTKIAKIFRKIKRNSTKLI
jgi:hypothetical protein